jgi:hypothetical protein
MGSFRYSKKNRCAAAGSPQESKPDRNVGKIAAMVTTPKSCGVNIRVSRGSVITWTPIPANFGKT